MKGQPSGHTFVGRCIPLRLLITYSYKIIDSQLGGGPGWMDSELYDFDAKVDHSVTRAEIGGMFQKLLADRFQFRFHRETRAMPSLVLTVDKAAKMTPNDSTYEWEIPVQSIPGLTPKVKSVRCPMSYLTWWIVQRQQRPVVDETGLGGFWDFTLEFVPELPEGRRRPNGEPVQRIGNDNSSI